MACGLVAAFGSAPGLAVADEGTVRALDEAQFLAELGTADPRVERLDAEIDAAQADVIAAGVRADPSVAVDREEVFADRGAATNYLRLTLPIDVSGRRGRRIGAARATARAVAADADLTRSALLTDGLRVFYQAAHVRLHLEALRGERDALVRGVAIVRKRSTAGTASGYDLQRVEIELAKYDDLIVSAEIALEAARTRLAALVGDPAGRVDATATLELPAPPPSLASLLPEVLEGRGDYRAARLRATSADERVAAAGRAWVPSFSLSGGAMTADVDGDTAFGYVVGLAISVPIFDRGKAERVRAQAARRVADADARWLERAVPAAVRTAHETMLRRLAQATLLATAQLARLEDLLRAAETAYREGEGSVVELLDAHQAARDTRLRDLELRLEAWDAQLDLWRALGRRPGGST